MLSASLRMFAVVAVALIAAGCAVSEERSGPGADGIPEVVGVCAQDHPDCQDTLVGGEPPTGGNTPLAPSTDSDALTGLVVGDGLSVTEALTYTGTEPVVVRGYVVRTSDGALLCETLAESYPPQCGGTRLILTNPDATTGLVLIEDGDVQWSRDAVVFLGIVSGTDFTIDRMSSA